MQAGDEVLTTTQDYCSMLAALDQRRQREGIVVTAVDVPTPARSLDELAETRERSISSRIRLILISHPPNTNGQLFPVKRICEAAHARGIEVVVDGAPSFAQLDFTQTDLGCDYYGTSLHKWLLAPKGTGMLFIRRDKIEKLWPLLPALRRMRADDIRKFEQTGTRPLGPWMAVGEAIAFHKTIGVKRKEDRLRFLKDYWVTRAVALPNVRLLTPAPPDMSGAIATFAIPRMDHRRLERHLWTTHGILTQARAGAVTGLRVTPKLCTTLGELDTFGDVLEHVARNGLPEA